MYARILVAIDGSATSDKALEEAVKLARLSQARLRLVNVVDPLLHAGGYMAAEAYMADLQPAMLESARKLLAEAKSGIGAGLDVETEVIEGRGSRVSEAIVEHAGSWGADVIVLGTHGRRGIERVLLGSDAEQVVRHSPVPVLLVRHRD